MSNNNAHYNINSLAMKLNSNPLPIMHLTMSFKKKAMRFKRAVHLITFLGLIISVSQATSQFLGPYKDRSLLPFIFSNIYTTVSWISFMYIIDIDRMMEVNERFCWPLDALGLQAKRTITRAASFEEKKALLLVSVLPICIFYVFLDVDQVRRVDYVAYLFGQHLPQLEGAYLAIVVGWTVMSCPVIVAFPFSFYYSNWIQQFQTILFASYIEDILGTNSDTPNDVKYQQTVWETLKYAIIRHNEILKTFRQRIDFLSIKLTSLLFGLTGGFVAISCCINIVTQDRLVFSFVIFTFVTIFLEMMSSATQNYEDSHEAIFNAALTVPWYDWNVTNRKAYLLLVQLAAQLVPYKFLNVRVNRAFEVKFMEKVYAIGTIFIKLK